MFRDPKKLAVRSVASVLAAALLVVSPGLSPYEAAAQALRGSGAAVENIGGRTGGIEIGGTPALGSPAVPVQSGVSFLGGAGSAGVVGVVPAGVARLNSEGTHALALPVRPTGDGGAKTNRLDPSEGPAPAKSGVPVEAGAAFPGAASGSGFADAAGRLPGARRPETPEVSKDPAGGGRTRAAAMRLQDAAERSAAIEAGANRMPEAEAKAAADFTNLLGRVAAADAPDVLVPELRTDPSGLRKTVGPQEGLREISQGKDASSGGPALAAPVAVSPHPVYATSALGQFIAASLVTVRTAFHATAGMSLYSHHFLSWSLPAWLTWLYIPEFGFTVLSGVAAVGYAVLGARIAAAMRRHLISTQDEKPAGQEKRSKWSLLADKVRLFRRALATPIATPTSASPAMAHLPPHARDVVELHEAMHRRVYGKFFGYLHDVTHRLGFGELFAYLRQAAAHPRYLWRELLAASSFAALLSYRAWTGLQSLWDMTRRMAFGSAALAYLVKPYKGPIARIIVYSVFDAILNVGLSLSIGPLLGIHMSSEYFAWFLKLSIGIVAGFLAYVFVEWRFNIGSESLAQWAARDFANATVSNLVMQSMEFFGRKGNDSDSLANQVRVNSNFLAQKEMVLRLTLVHYFLYLTFGVGAAVYTHFYLSIPILILMPLIGGVTALFLRKLRNLNRDQADLKAEMFRYTQEAFRHISLIRSSGTAEAEVARYIDKSRPIQENERAIVRQEAKVNMWNTAFADVMLDLMYISGGLMVAVGGVLAMTLPKVYQMGFFAGFIKYAVLGITFKFVSFKQFEGQSGRVPELIKQKPDIADAPNATPLNAPVGVRFEHVTFAYPTEDKAEPARVLNDLSFEILPGKTVAFVGETGSGKSTITSLILRLREAQGGRVLLNNEDVRNLDTGSLRARIAVVDQETELFSGTIRENMKFGSEDASDERLTRAIQMARAGFVYDKNRFPDGLETNVAEAGSRLSGGEKQRVAIVRALLREPSLLILDEATSALDNGSERVVQEALDQLTQGDDGSRPTTVVIAHRLTTVRNADVIHVLDAGRIVESGTHEELLALGGRYAKLWRDRKHDANAAAVGQIGVSGAAFGIAGMLFMVSKALWARSAFASIAVSGLAAVPVAIAGLAFLISGVQVTRAMAKYLSTIEAGGPRGPSSWLHRFGYVLFTPIATAAENSPAFANLSKRTQDFIETHERAHRKRGAGELRAMLAQARPSVVFLFLEQQLRAARISMIQFGRKVKIFIRGDSLARPILARHFREFVLGIVFLAGSTLAGIVSSQILKKFINTAAVAAATSITPHATALGLLAAAVLGVSLLNPWVTRKSQLLVGNLTVTLKWELRYLLYERLLRRDMKFHMANPSPVLAGRQADDIEKLASKNVSVRLPLMQQALAMFLSGAFMLHTSLPLSMIVFSMLLVLGVIGGRFAQQSDSVSNDLSNGRAKMGRIVQEIFSLIRVAKTFGREKEVARRFAAATGDLAVVGVKSAWLRSTAFIFQSSIADLFTKYLIYILGIYLGLPLGDILAMTILSGIYKEASSGISKQWSEFNQAHGETRGIRRILGKAPEVVDRPDARPLMPGPHEIRFENVSFRYDSKEGTGKIVDGFSLDIKRGQKVAVVGETGSGKSTVVKLLQRQWEQESGRILIDGNDIRELTYRSLADQIAVVSQEAEVFDDTIEFNMRYGAPKDISEDEFMAVVRAAAPFVLKEKAFPAGLKTRTGEGGRNLSGGQRQRIAIVRAILRKPRILLLDEATSKLDKETEREIQEVLDRLASGASSAEKPTTLVVAHNLTTIQDADVIVVMDKGRIAEIGKNRELLSRGGIYRRLWDASLKEQEQEQEQEK